MNDIEAFRELRKYKLMYYRLFKCYSDALNAKTKEESDDILFTAQLECYNIYTGAPVFERYYLSDERGLIAVLNLLKKFELSQPKEKIDYDTIKSIDDWIDELYLQMPELPPEIRSHCMLAMGDECDNWFEFDQV